MPVITKFIAVTVAAIVTGLTGLAAAQSQPSPLQNRERVSSSHGLSFLPPQGSHWLEQFGENQISYFKRTDIRTVSFLASAVEGKLQTKLLSKESLVAFVRAKKGEWGTDGRYFNTSSSFQVEDQDESCVRYRLSAHDRGAKNKAGNDFLVLRANGKFCVHPQDRAVAIDIYYSVRHVPQFDPKDFIAEGEEFLQGLRFEIAP